MTVIKSINIPQPIIDPAEWYPTDLATNTTWKHHLTNTEVNALLSLAKKVRKKTGDDANALLTMDRDSFSLGAFEPMLENVYSELRNGLGVKLIRGLPLDEIDLIDAAIIYWAIGRHLGVASPNNPEGDLFGHITDLGKTQTDANSRGYQTREAMDYHCDQCDIVGLLCIRTAKSGGTSKVASSISLYNTLLAENPRYTEMLSEPLYWTKHGEHAPDEQPYYRSPVFIFHEGKLCTAFGPKHIYKGYDLPGTPDINDELKKALHRAEEIADDLHFAMELERGDMQFVNNYVSLHTRSAYIDHEDPGRKRLLWRLWLMNEGLRERTAYARQWANGVSVGTTKTKIRLV